MNTYIIRNEKTAEAYEKQFDNVQQAIEWVENHLDLSLNWIVRDKYFLETSI